MTAVIWAPRARSALTQFLFRLEEIDPRLPGRAFAEIDKALERIAERPMIARTSRWAGYREWSVLSWRKIIIFRVRAEAIEIAGFFDARQDIPPAPP